MEPVTGPMLEGLHCPLCRYDVRGLPEPRCPECGHRFDWEELTNIPRQNLAWLFEHRRRWQGYVACHLRLLRPWAFWKSLRPAHRIEPRRLAWWVLLWLMLVALVPAAVAVSTVVRFDQTSRTLLARNIVFRETVAMNAEQNRQFMIQRFPRLSFPWQEESAPFWQMCGRELWWNLRTIGLPAGSVFFAMPAGAFVVLAVLRQSRRKVKATPVQLFRVVAYLLPTAPLVVCAAIGASGAVWPGLFRNLGPWFQRTGTLPWLWAAYLFFVFSTYFAMRRYLDIRHPLGVTLAIAVVSLLLGLLFASWFIDLWFLVRWL
jgi:hypothetical protein